MPALLIALLSDLTGPRHPPGNDAGIASSHRSKTVQGSRSAPSREVANVRLAKSGARKSNDARVSPEAARSGGQRITPRNAPSTSTKWNWLLASADTAHRRGVAAAPLPTHSLMGTPPKIVWKRLAAGTKA